MKYKLGLFAMLSFAFGVVHAGHDFMEAFRQGSTLVKEDSCSKGKTKIEYRTLSTPDADIPIIFVTMNPPNIPSGSPTEIFDKLIFYQIGSGRTTEYMIKPPDSGDLIEFTRLQ